VPLSRCSLKTLVPSFDIFKTDNDGHLIWCGTAATMADANSKALQLAQADQCTYVIFNHKSGVHLTVHPISSANGSKRQEAR